MWTHLIDQLESFERLIDVVLVMLGYSSSRKIENLCRYLYNLNVVSGVLDLRKIELWVLSWYIILCIYFSYPLQILAFYLQFSCWILQAKRGSAFQSTVPRQTNKILAWIWFPLYSQSTLLLLLTDCTIWNIVGENKLQKRRSRV